TQAQLEAVTQQRDQLAADVQSTKSALDAAQAELRQNAADLGRLQAVAEQVDPLKAQVTDLQKQLADLNAGGETRVSTAVQAALQQAQATHDQAVQQWNAERASLQQQIDDLKKQLQQAGVTGEVAPVDLAGHFASVLETVAAAPPAPDAAQRGF